MPELCVLMMRRMWRTTFVVIVLLLVGGPGAVSSASATKSTTKSEMTTPVPNFASSWAASEAHGTTIVLPCYLPAVGVVDSSSHTKRKNDNNSLNDEDGFNTCSNDRDDMYCCNAAVIIMRSTGTRLPLTPSTDRPISQTVLHPTTEMGGLRLVQPTYHSSDCWSTLPMPSSSVMKQQRDRWTMLGETAICCMTGFAPDVDYLTRFLQQQIVLHQSLYEGTTLATTTILPIRQIVYTLSQALQDACQAPRGGRPYGIQALLIGSGRPRHVSNPKKKHINPHQELKIYTLDPSGGYRHWNARGGTHGLFGTAIGRGAALVRKKLVQRVSKTTTPSTNSKTATTTTQNAIEALRRGLAASIAVQREETATELLDQYDAVFLWIDEESGFAIAPIDASQLREISDSIVNEMDAAKENQQKESSATP